jgi:hypothetical protein
MVAADGGSHCTSTGAVGGLISTALKVGAVACSTLAGM